MESLPQSQPSEGVTSAPTSALGSRTLASAAYTIGRAQSPWSQTTPLLPAIPSQIRPSLPVPGVQTKAGGLQRSLPKQPAGRAIGVAATGLGPGLARSGLESPGPHCIFSVTPRARQSARAHPVAPCTPTCVPMASPCPRGAICAVVVTAAPPSRGCCEDDVSCNR